jgi:hypothetical protein
MQGKVKDAMSHNGSRVGGVALRPTGPKGHVAERRAAAPRSPIRLPRRRCTYALLSDVAFLSVLAFASVDNIELSCAAVRSKVATVFAEQSLRYLHSA